MNFVGGHRSTHVIVIGNEKGGSGKSTTAMHVIVHLLKSGQRVGCIDLDSRQLSLSRYLENRQRWSDLRGLNLEMPAWRTVPKGESHSVREIEAEEFNAFSEAVSGLEGKVDFLVIDTPGHDSFLMRLAHAMADTLITPVNDSFVDLDVLGRVDPVTSEIVGISHYSKMVREARRKRRFVDDKLLDWVVLRNRLTMLSSHNQNNVRGALEELAVQIGYRLGVGISERVVFKAFFPKGLTALDNIDEQNLGERPNMSHLAARQEIRDLIATLRLPIDQQGFKRAATRQAWLAASARPMDPDDLII
ncbi:MAG: AAA family ATPase [Rhodobiaceae bacterium]|nr:AAA family ATPase [Rhodobiaceae bacterium]